MLITLFSLQRYDDKIYFSIQFSLLYLSMNSVQVTTVNVQHARETYKSIR